MQESDKDNGANIEGNAKLVGRNLGKRGNSTAVSSAPGAQQATMVTSHTDCAGTPKVHPMMPLKPTVCADSNR